MVVRIEPLETINVCIIFVLIFPLHVEIFHKTGNLLFPLDTTHRSVPASGILELCCHGNSNMTHRSIYAAGGLDHQPLWFSLK